MPLGFDRINERTQRPNAQINFIKPLTSQSAGDQGIAKDFLERIAAQCFRVMKKHYISVMSLEEFPYNQEFLGRNFNAGEVIQLVLRDRNGNWLSFRFVQMVMMHELAHCKQMNHSRFFWKERNLYAEQMRELWKEGYTGEGIWGKGKALANGRIVHDRVPEQGDVPEHLCGGTYRRARGQKRKRNAGEDERGERPKTSYAERQQKRIARKFGVHGDGNALGEDELVRGGLEQKQRHQGKPRVAQSKRGRELRAMAALARLEGAQKQLEKEDQSTDDEWSDSDDGSMSAAGVTDIVDVKDGAGNHMVQVCGDEGEKQDEGGGEEMAELRMIGFSDTPATTDQTQKRGTKKVSKESIGLGAALKIESDTESESGDSSKSPSEVTGHQRKQSRVPASELRRLQPEMGGQLTSNTHTKRDAAHVYQSPRNTGHDSQHTRTMAPIPTSSTINLSITCPICSLDNDPSAATCMVCSHVLKPGIVPGHWRCRSSACKDSKYINSGDVARCGVCGAARQNVPDTPTVSRRPLGVVEADILRWD